MFDVEDLVSAGICSQLGLNGRGVLDGGEDPSGVLTQSAVF